MKKIIAQVFVCCTVVVSHSMMDAFPTFQKLSKKKICEIETDSILASEKFKKFTNHLSKEEKEELLQLKELQVEFCD
ncbi:hypothetical protein [Polaribacter porphyrae]|uniref:Uncharacterized protein n=1 Tax=Polaribacter porphyrae TaxID=1137780 RepID=A0A2S7WK52_9FLAO|nr:hypothetical protein [Polaribacter porphyrae]PQJ77979.1 hypothetical protein BTO18_01710 [Polaribacter porphyrae]